VDAFGRLSFRGAPPISGVSDLRISSPAQPPASSAGAEAIKAVEGPQ